MTTRTISPRLLIAPLCLVTAALAVGCGNDRDNGRGGGTSTRRDAGTSSTAADGGMNNNNNPGPDGGMVTDCTSNPNACAQFELLGPPPGCLCLNVCETGYTWNSATQMCDPVGGAVCGNNIVEAGEQCDDGNTTNGDGCSSTCQNEMQGMICDDACQMLVDCTEMECPGTVDFNACVQQCQPDPTGFQADLILTLSCAEINMQLCPNTAGTNAGDPCTADSDCMTGNLQPFCILPTDMDGMPTGWEGGYCTGFNCRSDADCGTGNICVQIDQQGNTACFRGCDVATNGAGVCRMGYQCPDLSGGQDIGACFPACTSDDECAQGETCNLMTGQCT